MTLKSITLHRAAVDNAGKYVDAGTELAIGDAEDQIAADRARELVESHGGQGHHAHKSADDKKSA